jgi:hypothetical protein
VGKAKDVDAMEKLLQTFEIARNGDEELQLRSRDRARELRGADRRKALKRQWS